MLEDAMRKIRQEMHAAMRPGRPMQELAGRGNELRGGGVQPLHMMLEQIRAQIRNPNPGVKRA